MSDLSPAVLACLERHEERMKASLAERAKIDARLDQASAFKAHLAYLDALKASRPGPLVLRDEWEAAEWWKYSAYLDRLWNTKPEVMRAMEILRRRANARRW